MSRNVNADRAEGIANVGTGGSRMGSQSVVSLRDGAPAGLAKSSRRKTTKVRKPSGKKVKRKRRK